MNLLEYYNAIQESGDTWKRIVAALWLLIDQPSPQDSDVGAWERLRQDIERDAGAVARVVLPGVVAVVPANGTDAELYDAVVKVACTRYRVRQEAKAFERMDTNLADIVTGRR